MAKTIEEAKKNSSSDASFQMYLFLWLWESTTKGIEKSSALRKRVERIKNPGQISCVI